MAWNKVISANMMQRIQFSKKRASPAVLDRLAQTTQKLNAMTGNRFGVARQGFGRNILAFETSKLLLTVVSNDSRPTRFAVVGVTTDNRPLFPGHVEADLAEVCTLLGATTEEEVDGIKKLVRPWSSDKR